MLEKKTKYHKISKTMNSNKIDILKSIKKLQRIQFKTINELPKNFIENILSKKLNKNIRKNLKSLENLTKNEIPKFQINFKSVNGHNNQIKKINQDNYFISQNFIEKGNLLLGVIDGHGKNGHEVSNFIKERFSFILINFLFKNISKNKIIQVIKNSFLQVNNILLKNINCDMSGCTLSIILIFDKYIYCANVWDSKINLIKENNNSHNIIQITKDHFPTIEIERKRIFENGGEIYKLSHNNNDKSPDRIWIKNKNIPGLMITRSLGDIQGRNIVLIASPYISISNLKNTVKCIILGTDGLWDFLTEEELIKLYKQRKNIFNFAEKLINISKMKWIQNKFYNDDITCISLFINY